MSGAPLAVCTAREASSCDVWGASGRTCLTIASRTTTCGFCAADGLGTFALAVTTLCGGVFAVATTGACVLDARAACSCGPGLLIGLLIGLLAGLREVAATTVAGRRVSTA